ncbi:unnamed protein product [Prorocentrum cordatum]|uniref:RNA-directed RNA polymerase n=1 Tax=Prorocentrum cordatum TaxID=2364126 RepID=A0ABN9VNQ3_9DINO|nr:unnamed protein product [Polarella glacialis]
MANGENYISSVDPKIPALKGETLKDFTRYRRAVQAAELGCESKEQRPALGPKLHRNLLGADNSISVLIEQTDPRDYAVEDGANVLLDFLETGRFAKSSFRELPKAFDAFFDLARFERKGEEPMAAFCTAIDVTRRNLEEVGPDTKISSNELEYRALKRSGLDKDERDLVIARADETFNSVEISTTPENLFPRGGSGHRGQENRAGWKWTVHANDTRTDELMERARTTVSTGSRMTTGTGMNGTMTTESTHANYIHMQLEKDSDPIVPDRSELEVMISSDIVPASLVDSGASIAARWSTTLSKQKWIIPVGIGKKHVLQEYFEIPGDMVGLTSRKDLAEWKTNLYMRELEPDAFLVAETLQECEPGFEVKGHADSWVVEALKNGSKGIFKKGTLKRIDKLMKKYSVIFDVLRVNRGALLWELFAKEARFTRVTSKGGHANAMSSDLSVGVNSNDTQTQSDFLFLIKTFEPWMVSVAFPCAPFSNVQEFQRAQGMGDRVDDLIDEFRPLVDFSAKVLQTQRHEHADTVGRGALLSRASAWPDHLGKTLVSAGAHELARRTDLKKPGRARLSLCLAELCGASTPCTLTRACWPTSSDAYAGDPNFATVELVARYPTDAVVVIYVKEPKVQTSIPATVPLLVSRPEAFKPDDREADAVHRDLHRDGESFGDKASDITAAQWGALRKLHLNLSHPSARALKRRLKSNGVSQKVLDAVGKLDCVVCKELGGPNASRSANLKLSTEFNENAFLDETEEAPQLKGRMERAIGFFKGHLQRPSRDVQLTKTSVIANTCNNRIRLSGFTLYQYVLGRSPNVPASLIEAMVGDRRQLAAQSAALFADGPRTAEQFRAAANWAFFELDSDDAVRRATVGRVRPPCGPSVPGQLVFYWREVKHVKSKRLQGERGWRGRAIVLAAEGHARLHLSYRRVPVLVAPEQVRHASRGEAEMVENEDLTRRRKKDDGDSDNEGAVGDALATRTREATPKREKQVKRTHLNLECYPKYRHFLEM